jgi:hypothetical protein
MDTNPIKHPKKIIQQKQDKPHEITIASSSGGLQLLKQNAHHPKTTIEIM